MAKKSQPQHLAIATFLLALLGVLGTAGVVVFNAGKDVGAYEERLARLERQTNEVAIAD